MKEKIKKILWLILKGILSIEYALGFIPAIIIHYFLDFFKKTRNEKEFDKRLLYIQVFIFPITVGILIAFLLFYFNFFILKIFATIFCIFYTFNIIEFQYKDDPIIESITEGDKKRMTTVGRNLRIIKLITFWITAFVVGVFIPYK
jgi:hypothetical protein